MITQKEATLLNSRFYVEDGKLHYKKVATRFQKVGDEVKTTNNRTCILDKSYRINDIAWLLQTNTWPPRRVCTKSNIDISNLYLAPKTITNTIKIYKNFKLINTFPEQCYSLGTISHRYHYELADSKYTAIFCNSKTIRSALYREARFIKNLAKWEEFGKLEKEEYNNSTHYLTDFIIAA